MWVGLAIVYVFGLVIIGTALGVDYDVARAWPREPERARDAARGLLLLPIWPLVIVPIIVIGIPYLAVSAVEGVAELIRVARDKDVQVERED